MVRVGIICEGSSDYPVLQRVVEFVLGASDVIFRDIQPDFDALSRHVPGTSGPGWQGVRDFLGKPALAVAAQFHDILVIQVDADVRRSATLAPRLGADHGGLDELQPLCDEVKRWMSSPTPECVINRLAPRGDRSMVARCAFAPTWRRAGRPA